MSTRPLGPPEFLPDDPGPWSIVSNVFSRAGAPGKRRPQPPTGLMLAPPPEVGRPLAGLDPASPVAGVGPMRLVAAAREPAFALEFDPEGDVLRGVSPYVRRAWSVPDLAQQLEERPGTDPVAELPGPVAPGALGEDLGGAAEAPGGGVAAVLTREGRHDVIALVRTSDRALVRWIRGARAAAWSADGSMLAIGGVWGVVLARPHPPGG